MLNRLIATIISFAACVAIYAQEICTINGNIADLKLENGKKIKKVTLVRIDEFGNRIELGKAKVKKGKYTFTYKIGDTEPVMMYNIEGFGKNCIEIFVEPGVIDVYTENAAKPCQSKVSGTVTNDLFAEYKEITANSLKVTAEKVATLEQQKGKEWLNSKEGKEAINRIKSAELIKRESDVIKFLIEHNESPMTPFEMERSVIPYLSAAYAGHLVKSVALTLRNHPYYTSLNNTVLARNLKVGNEIPDIAITLRDGTIKRASEYRGKYILFDFWKSDCNLSLEQRPDIEKLYELIKNEDNFVIISISLDKEREAWEKAIGTDSSDNERRIHGCDFTGFESPAAKAFGIKATPRIILVAPEGRAISLDMKSEEAIQRVEQILDGDLYYLDQE